MADSADAAAGGCRRPMLLPGAQGGNQQEEVEDLRREPAGGGVLEQQELEAEQQHRRDLEAVLRRQYELEAKVQELQHQLCRRDAMQPHPAGWGLQACFYAPVFSQFMGGWQAAGWQGGGLQLGGGPQFVIQQGGLQPQQQGQQGGLQPQQQQGGLLPQQQQGGGGWQQKGLHQGRDPQMVSQKVCGSQRHRKQPQQQPTKCQCHPAPVPAWPLTLHNLARPEGLKEGAEKDNKCYGCNQAGHLLANCPCVLAPILANAPACRLWNRGLAPCFQSDGACRFRRRHICDFWLPDTQQRCAIHGCALWRHPHESAKLSAAEKRQVRRYNAALKAKSLDAWTPTLRPGL